MTIVTPDSPEALDLYRHSTAHLLAAAVTALFPEAQCGIGPPIDEGFFYDFVVDRPFVPEDLVAIEQKMKELASRNLRYERKMLSKEDAKAYFDERGEPLKVQLIEEKGGPVVSCYTIDDVFHRLLYRSSCAINRSTQGLQGAQQLECLLEGRLPEPADAADLRDGVFSRTPPSRHTLRDWPRPRSGDHRKLGKELGLFSFHHWAPGAPFWKAKGTVLYTLLTDYMRSVLAPEGYLEVRTPLVFNKKLWETSGHWDHYRDNMFLVESEGEPFALKAMNCPGHMLMFCERGDAAIGDLPLRFS